MSFPLDYKSHHAVSICFCLSLDISITLSDELKHVSRLFKYIDGHKNKTFFLQIIFVTGSENWTDCFNNFYLSKCCQISFECHDIKKAATLHLF